MPRNFKLRSSAAHAARRSAVGGQLKDSQPLVGGGASPRPARPHTSYYLWLAIPVLTVLNQACMKLLATRLADMPLSWEWLVQAVHTPWMLGIVICESASFVLWLTILADTGISKATPITAIAYVLILLMSWTIFKEPVMPLHIIGSILILCGVWLISTASSPSTEHSS